MKLGNPVHVTGEVHQIRGIGARVTVLTAGGEAILVDAGMRGSSPFIAGGLQALGLSLDAVRAVVISHRHPDHASGVGELVAGREIAVMAHPLEAGILGSAERHPSPFQNRLAAQVAQPVLDAVSGNPIAVDAELEDGQAVPFPYPVQVVHLPGHTAGSIALFLPEQKLVVVGDALQYKLGQDAQPPGRRGHRRPGASAAVTAKAAGPRLRRAVLQPFPSNAPRRIRGAQQHAQPTGRLITLGPGNQTAPWRNLVRKTGRATPVQEIQTMPTAKDGAATGNTVVEFLEKCVDAHGPRDALLFKPGFRYQRWSYDRLWRE